MNSATKLLANVKSWQAPSLHAILKLIDVTDPETLPATNNPAADVVNYLNSVLGEDHPGAREVARALSGTQRHYAKYGA